MKMLKVTLRGKVWIMSFFKGTVCNFLVDLLEEMLYNMHNYVITDV